MQLLQYLPLDFSNEHTVRLARFSFLLFIYLLVAALSLFCCMRLSLVVEKEDYSLVAVHALLISDTSLVSEHGQ